MDTMKNKVAVVAGGTGSVGEGIVRTLLGIGVQVVVPYRNEQKKQSLMDYVQDLDREKLHCWPVELGNAESMAALKKRLKQEFGAIDLAVACIGGWYYGYSLHNMPESHWETFIQDNLRTHFLVQKTLVSLMHEQNHGVYVMVNGGASEYIAPETGADSITAAAQLMMARVLKQEARGTDVRIYSLIGYNPIKTRVRKAEVMDEWVSAEEVGQYIVGLYEQTIPNTSKTIHRLYTRDKLNH